MVTNLEKSNELQENSFNQELKGLEREVKYNHLNNDGKWRERPSVPKDMRSVLEKYEGKTNLSDAEFKTYMGYINKYKTHSYLTNLTKITDYQATEFVKEATETSKEPYIDLRYLTSITDKQAEVLGKVKYLDLSGLKSITDKQAECLSKINTLFLNGLTSITDKQAEVLGKVKDLNLNGLKSITDKQAELLSKGARRRELSGLSHITDKQAEVLGKVKEYLALGGITSITDRQARELAKVATLYINIDILTPKQEQILLK